MTADVGDVVPEPSMESLRRLVLVMDRLRSPGGCPWDARQTHRTLVEYLIEEAYETVEAIEYGEPEHLREELGDLLLQVVFHARIAQEDPTDPWSIDDVAAGIADKLVARHPHVFGDVDAGTPEQVEARWHASKTAEKGRTSVTDGIPATLPGLVYAAKLLARSDAVGVAVPEFSRGEAILELVDDEAGFGELILGIVAAARIRGWDAESAIRMASRAHRVRVRESEGT